MLNSTNNKRKTLCLDVTWSGHQKCKTCAVHNAAPFADVSDSALNDFLQPIDNLQFSPRAHLFDQGNIADNLFTIRSGIVKLVQIMPNGTPRIVRLLHAGDLAGLEGLVGYSHYLHTAVAQSEVDVCRIATQTVHELNKHSPKLSAQLMLRWQKALNEADDFIVRLSTGSSTARLARLLLKLSALGENGTFVTPSREDIGAMLSVTPETVSRLMAEFKRNGWIKGTNSHCDYCDHEQLALLAMDLV